MKQIEHSTLSKPVYESLKSMILKNELKPGQKIIQEKIAKQLGVSRTPLMKALQQLEHEFFVKSIPRKGMYVQEIDLEGSIHVYDCREGIEIVAARLACEKMTMAQIAKLKSYFAPFKNVNHINVSKYEKADEHFHDDIVKFSGNPILEKLYVTANIRSRIMKMGLLRIPEETINEHARIIDAFEKRDVARVEIEMKYHIRNSRQLLIDKLKKTNSEK